MLDLIKYNILTKENENIIKLTVWDKNRTDSRWDGEGRGRAGKQKF